MNELFALVEVWVQFSLVVPFRREGASERNHSIFYCACANHDTNVMQNTTSAFTLKPSLVSLPLIILKPKIQTIFQQ